VYSRTTSLTNVYVKFLATAFIGEELPPEILLPGESVSDCNWNGGPTGSAEDGPRFRDKDRWKGLPRLMLLL